MLILIFLIISCAVRSGVSAGHSFISSRRSFELKCEDTGFNNVKACFFPSSQRYPPINRDDEKEFLQSSVQLHRNIAAKNLPYFRRIEMISYYIMTEKARWIGRFFRIRHPALFLRINDKEFTMTISYSNSSNYFIKVSANTDEPLSKMQADKRNYRGFMREFECYSSAMASDIADSIFKFSISGFGYDPYKNNCRHFARFMLKQLCGPSIHKKAQRFLRNPIMGLLGEWRTKGWRKNRREPPIPIIYAPGPSENNQFLQHVYSEKQLANLLMPKV